MVRSFLRNGIWVAAIALAATLGAQTDWPAELMPMASRSLLLDVSLAADRVVAVGERGHILLSDDYGKSWRQVPTPTRTTLTSVFFTDAKRGWAAGHENIILATTDGGETWTRQYTQGGIEEHYLDVYFNDPSTGLAVGAYGFAQMTRTGGKDWERLEVFDDELHFNRISRGPDGRLFLALEGGELLTSVDGGENWESLPSPYEGSLFGVLPLGPRTLLTYGLRGHVFRSTDVGNTWEDVQTPAHVLIMHGLRLSSGPVILAGQNGVFLVSKDAGRSFVQWQVPIQGAAALAECPDGAIIAVGLNGAHRLVLPTNLALEEAP